jgi:hypothetical protein
MSIYFKTLENKISVDLENYFHVYRQAVGKIALKILLTLD